MPHVHDFVRNTQHVDRATGIGQNKYNVSFLPADHFNLAFLKKLKKFQMPDGSLATVRMSPQFCAVHHIHVECFGSLDKRAPYADLCMCGSTSKGQVSTAASKAAAKERFRQSALKRAAEEKDPFDD